MNIDNPLRIVFMGTPIFAIPVLHSLVDVGYNIVGVYTRPDTSKGRTGLKPVGSPVKEAALKLGLPVYQPSSLRKDESSAPDMASLCPDVIIVAAYGLLLPARILNLPQLGCLNIHPSLLPKYRGPAPVVQTILNGDTVGGCTLMKLDAGMDAGPLLAQQETPIGLEETNESLTARLFEIGALLLVEALPQWKSGQLKALPQDKTLVSVTNKLMREHGEIVWTMSAAYIARQIRAYYPWPGTFTHWRGGTLKIIEAAAIRSKIEASLSQGEVAILPEGSLGIGTGDGVLAIKLLQLAGRNVVSGEDFARGHQEFVGSIL